MKRSRDETKRHGRRREHVARWGIKLFDVVRLDHPCTARCEASEHVGVVTSVYNVAGRWAANIDLVCLKRRAVTVVGLRAVTLIGEPRTKRERIVRKRARRSARAIYGRPSNAPDERSTT